MCSYISGSAGVQSALSKRKSIQIKMGWGGQWKHVVSLVAINFAFGLVNLLLKKALDQGLNHLVIVTYRQAISATFLFPIAYFWER